MNKIAIYGCAECVIFKVCHSRQKNIVKQRFSIQSSIRKGWQRDYKVWNPKFLDTKLIGF